MRRVFGGRLAVLAVVCAVLAIAVRMRFGGGARLDDRTTAPELPAAALEQVVALDYPPGNVAVAADGTVFFTYHPDGGPPESVMVLRDGVPVPFPSPGHADFDTVLALRIDRQGRLWTLDHGGFGRGQPRLLAFDPATGREVHRWDVPPDVAGLLSMLNDFQVDATGERIYIAESSPIAGTPALIVYDVAAGRGRRLLDGHPSVETEDYRIQAPGRDMTLLGLYTLRIGVDTIALDRSGEWLYFGPVTGATLWRVRTADLRDESLAPETLAARVERYAPKVISDGATTDEQGRVYLTDPEHSAVLALEPDRRLRTLVKDPRLRWPDGLSFGPDGWLYVTCSALQDVLLRSAAARAAHRPYHIYRFRPGGTAAPGH